MLVAVMNVRSLDIQNENRDCITSDPRLYNLGLSNKN